MSTHVLLFIVAACLHTVACVPEMVFGEEGKSITLVINGSDVEVIDHVFWIFNETGAGSNATDIVTYFPLNPEDRQLRVLSSYKSRVEFDNTTLSMELKNLMRNDSGLYTGEMKTPEDKTILEYYLSVFEPVEKPVLTTHLNWSSGDECQVMVTCRAGDLSVTSSCNISTCTQDGDSTHGGLSIFTRHGSIICNHSNPVSWRQDAVDIRDLCPPEQDPQMTTVTVLTAVGVTILLLLLSLLGGTLKYVHLKKQGDHVKHLYQEVNFPPPSSSDEEMRPPIEHLYSSTSDNLPRNAVVRSGGENPPAIYSEIQPHTDADPDLSCIDHVYSSVV